MAECRPSSKFLEDLHCWDKASRKVDWENGLDMKKATVKTKEMDKRATQFYRIAWVEQNDDDESLTVTADDETNARIKDNCSEDATVNKIHEVKVGDAVVKTLERRKWKIQHFSEFKNDKVKREQVRKLIKSKELMMPVETLSMKPLSKKRRLSIVTKYDENNNVKVDDVIKEMKSLIVRGESDSSKTEPEKQ